MAMKKLTILIVASLLSVLSSCTNNSNGKLNFDIVSSNVTVLEDATGGYSIKLIVEVSNINNKQIYLKASDFDIIDEDGTLIDTMKSVSAYPSLIDTNETAVYYDTKVSDKISDSNIKLKAIPHIEYEKLKVKQKDISIKGISGWRGENAIGIIRNLSSRTEYKNVQIVIVGRTQSNEVVSVLTAKIDLIKPREYIEFEAEERLIQGNLGSATIATKYQNFAYIDPEGGESIYTIENLIYLVLFLLICGGIAYLQIFLSKKQNKWLGLILPLISLILSSVCTLMSELPLFREMSSFIPKTVEKTDEFGNLISSTTVTPPSGGIWNVVFITIMVFLIYNISTLILMAIYWVCRRIRKRHQGEKETV